MVTGHGQWSRTVDRVPRSRTAWPARTPARPVESQRGPVYLRRSHWRSRTDGVECSGPQLSRGQLASAKLLHHGVRVQLGPAVARLIQRDPAPGGCETAHVPVTERSASLLGMRLFLFAFATLAVLAQEAAPPPEMNASEKQFQESMNGVKL